MLDFEDDHGPGGVMTLTCDNCSDDSEFYGSWDECIEEAKENGWVIIPPDYRKRNAFYHFCSGMCFCERKREEGYE